MKIRLEIGPDAEVAVEKDADDAVVAVVVTPTFVKKTGTATVIAGVASTEKGKVLDRFVMTVSGGTGKVAKVAAAETVVPAVDE